jgi:ABC-2 type transport system ATP-binding protein
MPPLLEAQTLVKQYPEVRAVDGVSFELKEGQCFGLLGPNGAGKTTTVEILEGVTEATSGSVLFRGQKIDRSFREEAGIQFQSTALPENLRVQEVLELFGKLYKRSYPIQELIETCALGEYLDRDTRKLSGGQRQRLLLALALVNDPKIVFLDEPTTGLDPQSRRNFWELIRRIQAQGKTILLTTHYMEEARVLCDEIAIMDRGRIIAQGEPGELLKHSFETVFIRLPVSEDALPADFAWPRRARGNGVEIETTDVNDAMRLLVEAGVDLGHMQVESPTLEDLFLELTGKDLRA